MTESDPDLAGVFQRFKRDRDLSYRQLAKLTNYSSSYVEQLAKGTRPITAVVAARLDETLGTSLSARLGAPGPVAAADVPRPPSEPMDGTDVEHLHDTVRHFVALDTMHGSDGLATAAARAFHTARHRLATVGVRPDADTDLRLALAELGEVAAWLAFDSERQELSRQLAAEALLIAQAIGDTAMARFVLSHMSMQALYLDRPSEALDLAGRVLADDPRSRRVTGMMRVRRARALGKLGGTEDAMRELARARHELDDGVGPDDPAWTWWWNVAELARHESHIRLAGGDAHGAVAASERAVEAVPDRQGRDQALFRAGLLSDLVEVRSWHEVDRVAAELTEVAAGVGSARVPRYVRTAARRARRAAAPGWVVESMDEAADVADPAA